MSPLTNSCSTPSPPTQTTPSTDDASNDAASSVAWPGCVVRLTVSSAPLASRIGRQSSKSRSMRRLPIGLMTTCSRFGAAPARRRRSRRGVHERRRPPVPTPSRSTDARALQHPPSRAPPPSCSGAECTTSVSCSALAPTMSLSGRTVDLSARDVVDAHVSARGVSRRSVPGSSSIRSAGCSASMTTADSTCSDLVRVSGWLEASREPSAPPLSRETPAPSTEQRTTWITHHRIIS